MKNILAFIIIASVLTACNFSAGTNKDLVTGMKLTYSGFRVGKAYLVNGQNQVTTSNVVSIGETVAIEIDEVENYELQEGRAFPVVDLVVTDKDGVVVLEGRDILATEQGYAPEDAAVLRGTVTVGNPMKAGETYHAQMTVADKIKPENKIEVTVDLVVK